MHVCICVCGRESNRGYTETFLNDNKRSEMSVPLTPNLSEVVSRFRCLNLPSLVLGVTVWDETQLDVIRRSIGSTPTSVLIKSIR